MENKASLLPLLALRGTLVFPGMIVNLDVGREKSINAVEAAMAGDKKIFLVAQKDAIVMEPRQEDLYGFGIIAEVKQLLKLPSGALRILVEGIARASLDTLIEAPMAKVYYEAGITYRSSEYVMDNEVEALRRMLIENFEQWILATKKVNSEVLLTFRSEERRVGKEC